MTDFVPAAQYLRMSTEHQQYSLENQSAAIQKYAELNGFEIVKTYADPARTGVVLKRRDALQQLLRDVVSETASYRAVLVYDVSRWGRFQDSDESAHYEFLCKAAGIPIHYCSETFANDGTLPSMIMKALKRTMAGEYSREMGVKVFYGLKRMAELGFKQGGMPGYGLRRMLISGERRPKQQLAGRERKSIATDRVILVPGPANEIRVVRAIFRMLIIDGLSVRAIATELNQRRIQYSPNSQWDYAAVYGILTGLKYIGCHVFGRTSSKLYTPLVRLPKSEWLVISGAFEPIIEYATFAQAQQILYWKSSNKSEEEMLDGLKNLLKREGRLSGSLIERTDGLASPSTYRWRFGSLRNAYAQIGYGQPRDFGPIDLRRRTQALRDELIGRILKLFPDEVEVLHRGGRWRPLLRLWKRVTVSVLVTRTVKLWKDTVLWRVEPKPDERKFVTLLARLDSENSAFFDFHVLPNADRPKRYHLREDDAWLNYGQRIAHLGELCQAVGRILEEHRTD